MNELTTADELVVQLPQRDEKTLQEYLPESFGPSDLGIKSGLMASIDHGKKCEESDEMVLKALDALNKSHAPYTHNLSGVSIKLKNGKVYQGAYAENAAFNLAFHLYRLHLSSSCLMVNHLMTLKQQHL